MKRKRLSETNQLAVAAYEAAAERIGSGESIFACCALNCAGKPHHRTWFEVWFCPEEREGLIGWWPDWLLFQHAQLEHQLPERTRRILALLLMAELVRDGQIDFDAP